MSTSSNEIVFYDIALYDTTLSPPVICAAPNPWKARYALNFKGVNYRTAWTEFLDIADVRKKLNQPANRVHPDGSPFYTLPIIQDPTTGKTVGDTFDIALYLDEAYPDGPRLIPQGSVGVHAAFNSHVDSVFTAHTQLSVARFPFNPETAESCKASFARRIGLESWDTLLMSKEARETMMESFEKALEELAKFYRRRDEGPFLEGAQVTYADLIVGGWLGWLSKTIEVEEWERLASWQDGMWGKLHKALEKYARVH